MMRFPRPLSPSIAFAYALPLAMGLANPGPASAAGTPPPSTAASEPGAAAGLAAAPPVPAGAPADAATSLERVRAAYEYGDIDSVVEWARPVADGRIAASAVERGHALRYLGIGLYLTGRAPGAEAAFLELLRLRPDSTLDPRTTRPDVVTFFERVRAHHSVEIRASARENNAKIFVLNFLPPLGQFQNGHRGRAFLFGGLELISAATAVTTYSVLSRWEQPGHLFPGHENEAPTLKAVNWIALGVLGASYIAGVLDALAGYPDLPDEAPAPQRPATRTALGFGANGLSLTF